MPCPVGTIEDNYGNDGTSTPVCTPCPQNYYCDEVGLTTAILIERGKFCDPGYFCTEGAIVPYPEIATDFYD